MATRTKMIVKMKKNGKRNKEIALAFNTSIRTIQRALSAANHAKTGGTRDD